MKLLELAKKNLQEYIAVSDALEIIARTQHTPISYVAVFLISQNFNVEIATYDVDKFSILNSNDDFSWGKFQYTSSILSSLANDEKYKDVFTFDGSNLPENLLNTYWKRKDLYNLELIQNLSIDFYFRVQDIQNVISSENYFNPQDYISNDVFSENDVKNILKNGIPSYIPATANQIFTIDSFVSSSLIFFDYDVVNGYEISRSKLEQVFNDNQINIKGFSNYVLKINEQNSSIWEEGYLYIVELEDFNRMEDFNNRTDDWDDFSIDEETSYILNEDSTAHKKIPLYLKNKTFTPSEVACLISNYHPNQVGHNWNKLDWLKLNPDFEEALDFAFSAVRGGLFDEIDADYFVIDSDKLKIFLNSKDIFIDGFNSDVSQQNINFGNPTVGRASLEHYQKKNKELLERIEDLEKEVKKKFTENFLQDVELESVTTENSELKNKISLLESKQFTKASNLLEQIFDESATERYAPDLVLSIKLWEYAYITNPKNDSHSNKANNWIASNTGYDQSKPSASKLREITTPLINWSTHRDKNYKK